MQSAPFVPSDSDESVAFTEPPSELLDSRQRREVVIPPRPRPKATRLPLESREPRTGPEPAGISRPARKAALPCSRWLCLSHWRPRPLCSAMVS